MAIVYDKLFRIFQERGITSYTIKTNNIIGQATYQSIRKGTGGLDYRSLNRLCKYLDCQPGDIMEYIPDEDEPTEEEN